MVNENCSEQFIGHGQSSASRKGSLTTISKVIANNFQSKCSCLLLLQVLFVCKQCQLLSTYMLMAPRTDDLFQSTTTATRPGVLLCITPVRGFDGFDTIKHSWISVCLDLIVHFVCLRMQTKEVN